jgi:hypothetical protein
LLDILKEKNSDDIDEDKTVMLSLVPCLQKLSNDQKHWAKMEMSYVMRRAKNMLF